MEVFKNEQKKENFIRSFLNEKIKNGELNNADITNGQYGCYLSRNHGLLDYVSFGVKDSHAFLRFWEKENEEYRKEKIAKRRSFLEDHYEKIQQELGPDVKYDSFKKLNHYICGGDNTFKGFCAYYPDRKTVEELNQDINRLYSVYCYMRDNMKRNATGKFHALFVRIMQIMGEKDNPLKIIDEGKNCLQYKPINAKDDDWGKKKCHYEFCGGYDEEYIQICFHCEDNFKFEKKFQELAQKEESLDQVRNVKSGAKKTRLEPEYGKIFIGTDVGDVANNAVKQMLRFEQQYGHKILELIQKSKGEILSENSNNAEENMSASETNKDKIALNTILYGPPGTGKTFNTMAYAVAICEDKDVEEIKKEMKENYDSVKQRYDALKDEGRIEFVTFHQSYGYEDFIEGIKPILGDDDNPGLNYELHPGIFKNFCESAEKSFTNSLPDSEKDDAFDKSWNLLLKKLSESEDEKISIELKNKKSFSVGFNETRTGLYAGARRYFNKKQLRNIYNGQLGVPSGALDSYRRRIVEYMIKYCSLPEKAKKKEVDNNANQNYVFIIDEINRGNISKIFGELITLIEPSKRLGEKERMKVTLPCSGDEFGVPNNVYILGTMNTADRSIAMMDTALRRRFNFVEMMPDTSILKNDKGNDIGVDICKMLETINERIEYLYDREHTIGHAFFIGVDSLEKLSSVFKNKVIPLLQEYFYDDYEKIRLVLGDNEKDEEHQFITKVVPPKDLFKKNSRDEDLNTEKYIYRINQKAFKDPNSYKGII